MKAKRVGLLVCALGIAVGTAGITGHVLGDGDPNTERVLKATRFELVDQEGNLRATLAAREGSSALNLFHPSGKARVTLQMQADGTPALTFQGAEDARPDLHLALLRDGPFFAFRQSSGAGLSYHTMADGGQVLRLSDKKQRRRIVLELTGDGEPKVWIYDADDRPVFSAP